MKGTQLIELLKEQIAKNGDQEVVISDSHTNTCEVGSVEFIRYAHPTVVIHTKP